MQLAALASALVTLTATASAGAPTRLTYKQLDQVTAGALSLPQTTTIATPVALSTNGLRRWPLPAGWWAPPQLNPGGPILISCTIGIGCTIRPY